MARIAVAFVALGLLAAMAQAQSPHDTSENLVVTAPKIVPDALVSDFVRSRVAPSPVLGKLTRWEDAVCPVTDGLPRKWTDFINGRIRLAAEKAGAPVQAACKTNIEIVFTTTPQALLDNIRAKHPRLLGYHYAPREAELATVRYPVQAWYLTETEDLRGNRATDDANPRDIGLQMSLQEPFPTSLFLPGARGQNVDQSRLGDGLRSDLYHVLIVADPTRLRDMEMGALADYIAILALSQTDSFESCQPVPSITNLLSPGCDPALKPAAMTDFDLAYLRAVYNVDTRTTLQQQRNAIAYQMKKGLEGR